MSNPLYFLVGLLLASAYPLGFEPLRFVEGHWGLQAAVGAVTLYALLTAAVLRSSRRPGLARMGLRWLALVLYAAVVYVFHYPLWVWAIGLEGSPVRGSLVTLAPLLALFAVQAMIGILFDPRQRGRFWSAAAFTFRGFAAFSLVPVALMLSIDGLLQGVEGFRKASFVFPVAGWGLGLATMLILVLLLPFLIRVAYGARPLPSGPLRDRLVGLCASTGFRCRDLLVLRTGGARMANAFIVGAAGPARFIFFTDAIVEGMTAESLECVLAHEIAHSKRGHLRAFLLATLGFAFVNAAILEGLDEAGFPAAAALGLVTVWAGLFWVGLFGWVSRRFETEADLAAGKTAPAGIPGMVEALARVADLNRVPTWAWGWRHWSIERRVGILLDVQANPAVGEAFERRCAGWRRKVSLFLLVGLASVAALGVGQLAKAGERGKLWAAYGRAERGGELLRAGKAEEALVELRAAIGAGAGDGQEWLWVADAERALGRDGAARKAEAEARKRGVSDPRDRLRLER